MILRRTIFALAMLLASVGALRAIGADSETEAFIRDVIKDARTDSQRSTMLMDSASLADGNEKLKLVLLERSVQYGIKGLRTAEDCKKFETVIDALMEADPGGKALWMSQKASVYNRWSSLTKSSSEKKRLIKASVELLLGAAPRYGAKGDWKQASELYNQARRASNANRLPNLSKITALWRTATYLREIQTKIDAHIATLKKSPNNFAVRSDLIKKLVIVMDDPVGAMKHLNDDVDKSYRTFVPMAAKDIADVPVGSCKALGNWYHKGLSRTATGISKSRMLARARGYYEHVLAASDKVDVSTAVMKMSVLRIKGQQKKLGAVDPLQCVYCSATGKIACTGCGGSGLGKCRSCSGARRVKCRTCGGKWNTKCTRCGGRGKVVGSERRGAMVYKTYSKCSTCSGTGVTHNIGGNHSSSSSYYRRPGPCSSCWAMRRRWKDSPNTGSGGSSWLMPRARA